MLYDSNPFFLSFLSFFPFFLVSFFPSYCIFSCLILTRCTVQQQRLGSLKVHTHVSWRNRLMSPPMHCSRSGSHQNRYTLLSGTRIFGHTFWIHTLDTHFGRRTIDKLILTDDMRRRSGGTNIIAATFSATPKKQVQPQVLPQVQPQVQP
jgi:hypothetical protein